MSQAIDGRTSPTTQYRQDSVRHRSNTVSGRYSTLDGEAALDDSDTTLKTAECYKCHVEEVQSEMFQLYHDTFRSCQWSNVVICKPCKQKFTVECPQCTDSGVYIEAPSGSTSSHTEDEEEQLFPDGTLTDCLWHLGEIVVCGIVVITFANYLKSLH